MAREVDGSRKRKINHKIVLAKSIIKRSKNITSLHEQKKKKKQLQPEVKSKIIKIGDTIDILGLLFSPQRDFLVKNNGHKVRVDDLKGKTIVLYVVPLKEPYFEQWNTLDMIDAYNELLPMADVEFVFVAIQKVYPEYYRDRPTPEQEETYFNRLFSTIPFPTIPFFDKPSRDRVLDAFKLENMCLNFLTYWSIIDPTNTVVASSTKYDTLFNLYGGAELYPLTRERLHTLWKQRYEINPLLNNLDQLLTSPTRDFLLASNGIDRVPISSLKDKVVGLYFCVNIPSPRHMKLIAKMYEEVKLRGYDFEIVQINFHFLHIPMRTVGVENLLAPQRYENINWLTLPFKDPSCKKLQRIFCCGYEDYLYDYEYTELEDCLVIVDQRRPNFDEDRVEFKGIKAIELYGIEGYPFTRPSLTKVERRIQKESVKLKLLFPPGECHLIRPTSDGCDLIDGSILSGKRVLVLFASHRECQPGMYVSMLESKYYAQLRDVKEKESKFEVVYVSSPDQYQNDDESSFYECIKDMPWLVYPSWKDLALKWRHKIFKAHWRIGVAVFDENGELVAKKAALDYNWEKQEYHKLPFPFLPLDLEEEIRDEVDELLEQ